MHPPPGHHRGGSGPPLVLLHGIGGVWTAWRRVLDALEREHAVFAPTLPGHWGADAMEVPDPPTVAGMTDAIARRLEQEGIERPHVAGNSLGGWIGLELARRGLVRSVVGLSPAGVFEPSLALTVALKGLGLANALTARLERRIDELLTRPGGRQALLRGSMEHGERLTPRAAKEHLQATINAPVQAALMASFVKTPFEALDAPLSVPCASPGASTTGCCPPPATPGRCSSACPARTTASCPAAATRR